MILSIGPIYRKLFVPVLAIIALYSCNSGHNERTDDAKTEKETSKDSIVDAKNQQQELKKLFAEWLENEVKEQRLWAPDSCNMAWFETHPYGDTDWGYPAEKDAYGFSYPDLNGDGKLDQLVTFAPDQCDGGNGSMWAQIAVLITSTGNGTYKTITSPNEGIFLKMRDYNTGFFHCDSLGPNKIYATYYEFLEDDGHCCPTIQKSAVIAFDTGKVKIVGDAPR